MSVRNLMQTQQSGELELQGASKCCYSLQARISTQMHSHCSLPILCMHALFSFTLYAGSGMQLSAQELTHGHSMAVMLACIL